MKLSCWSTIKVCLFLVTHVKGVSKTLDRIYFPTTENLKSHCSVQYTQAITISEEIGTKLYNNLRDSNNIEDGSNWIISPVSIAALLGQLMIGAKGSLREVLGNLLSPSYGPTSLGLHRELGALLRTLNEGCDEKYILNIQSLFLLDKEIDLREPLKFALGDLYDVEVKSTDFRNTSTIEIIESWIRSNTRNFVEIFPLPLLTSASILLNSIYFKAEWRDRFYSNLTKADEFYVNESYKTKVEFMAGDMEILYHRDVENELEIIGVPYIDEIATLFIIMPKNGQHITEVINENLPQLIRKANESVNATLLIPKLKLTETQSLKDALLSASLVKPLPLLFTIDENLVDNEKHGEFRIDDVVHVIALGFDETGSEIASVSAVLIDYSGETPVIRVDRPFLFIIRHEETGAFLFFGIVQDPSSG